MKTPCLWYFRKGVIRKPVILLLHGAITTSMMWPDTFVNNLANNFNVYSLDLRESGKSGGGEKLYTLEDMADDVSYFMKIHRLKNVHLVGASMGGAISQLLAIKEQENVKSLSLLMTTSERGIWSKSMPPPTFEQLDCIKKEYEFYMKGDIVSGIKTRFDFCSADEKETQYRIKKMIRHGFNPFCGHLNAFETSPARTSILSKISCPTLILHGDEDTLFPLEHAYLMHENIENSKLNIVKGMGHFVLEKNSDILSKEIVNHINDGIFLQ